jgi:hypothetical protein
MVVFMPANCPAPVAVGYDYSIVYDDLDFSGDENDVFQWMVTITNNPGGMGLNYMQVFNFSINLTDPSGYDLNDFTIDFTTSLTLDTQQSEYTAVATFSFDPGTLPDTVVAGEFNIDMWFGWDDDFSGRIGGSPDVTNTQAFSITYTGGAIAIPEPVSIILLPLSFIGLRLLRKRSA